MAVSPVMRARAVPTTAVTAARMAKKELVTALIFFITYVIGLVEPEEAANHTTAC